MYYINALIFAHSISKDFAECFQFDTGINSATMNICLYAIYIDNR